VKKKVVKKPAVKKTVYLRTVPLVPGPATVAASRVNVRTRPSMVGEVVSHMTNGEAVVVIQEITLKHSGPDEPSAWAKIVLPSRAAAWVSSKYIDAATKTVNTKKLNIRGGPGEDYGVIGTLAKGDTITEVAVQGEWIKIEAPNAGYAYMAAQYLKQEAGEIPSVNPTPESTAPAIEPMPAPTPVQETPAVSPTGEMPAPEPGHEAPIVNPTPAPTTPPALETPDENLPKVTRIVTHEGIVRGTISIQAPTPYALIAPDTRETVNYLHTTSPELDLSRYKGLHIIVTGEESLDARWPHTPLITIQKIQVID
jgi:hypothetical protein